MKLTKLEKLMKLITMVDSGFTRKKVESLTLGEKLRKFRNDSRTSLQEISKATRIQVKYLEYLENGEYGKLPADVYVRGFLRSYARYLSIDEQTFIRLYERERNIQQNLGHEMGKAEPKKDFSPSSIVITSRSIMMVMIVCMVSGAFLYLYQEFRSFTAAPYLVVTEPVSSEVVYANETTVRGKTDRGARLFINNQPVFVGDDGGFSEKILLQPGLNSISIMSINRFDKEKSEMITVEADYVPATFEPKGEKSIGGAVFPEEVFFVDISAQNVPVKVIVRSDGIDVFSGSLKPGEMKHIEGKERISVTADNGAETFVQLNGGQKQALSSVNELIKDVVFLKTGRQAGVDPRTN